MSTFVPINSVVIPQAIADTSTTQLLPLGTRVRAYDVDSTAYGEGEFIYLLGVASTVVGSAATFNQSNHGTALLAANAIGPVAFAMSINVASNYGWYQIYGKAVGKVLAGFADNANCYGTATAGSMDDAIVAGDRVQNCKGASAINTPSAGLAELEIQYPFTNDALAN
jgi:hypothetical protein|tara:strand:- start:2057 stop:2560 length:504 start_codon:yes stop_codon:yes gene_type:complete